MADAETETQRLQVAILNPAEGGRGIARLPAKTMESLGITEGDVIEIIGKRSTAARAIRPYDDDHGLDIIRLDGLQRANAGVGSSDFVEVRKANSKPATAKVISPIRVMLCSSPRMAERPKRMAPLPTHTRGRRVRY